MGGCMKTNIIVLLSSFALSVGAFADERVLLANQLLREKGVYYALSPQLATMLKIDYDTLITALRLRSNESIVVKQDKDNDKIDISIFDSSNFSQARLDFVKN